MTESQEFFESTHQILVIKQSQLKLAVIKPNRFTEKKLNNLIRNMNLSKTEEQLFAFLLKEKIYQKRTLICVFDLYENNSEFNFSAKNDALFCDNIEDFVSYNLNLLLISCVLLLLLI